LSEAGSARPAAFARLRRKEALRRHKGDAAQALTSRAGWCTPAGVAHRSVGAHSQERHAHRRGDRRGRALPERGLQAMLPARITDPRLMDNVAWRATPGDHERMLTAVAAGARAQPEPAQLGPTQRLCGAPRGRWTTRRGHARDRRGPQGDRRWRYTRSTFIDPWAIPLATAWPEPRGGRREPVREHAIFGEVQIPADPGCRRFGDNDVLEWLRRSARRLSRGGAGLVAFLLRPSCGPGWD
jgi:hypothetical protein